MTETILLRAQQIREPALLALAGFMLMMSLAAIGAGNEAAAARAAAEAAQPEVNVVIAERGDVEVGTTVLSAKGGR